jgi:hypothetical protein
MFKGNDSWSKVCFVGRLIVRNGNQLNNKKL